MIGSAVEPSGSSSMLGKRTVLKTLIPFALAWLAIGVLAADSKVEIGFEGGFFLPDTRLSGRPETLDRIEPLFGLRAAVPVADRWGWFVDANWSRSGTETSRGDLQSIFARTGFERFFRPFGGGERWFVSFGGGRATFDWQEGGTERETFVSAGVGSYLRCCEHLPVRWELRADRTTGGDPVVRPQILIGFSWPPRRPPIPLPERLPPTPTPTEFRPDLILLPWEVVPLPGIEPRPAPREPWILRGVNFEFASSKLTKAACEFLEREVFPVIESSPAEVRYLIGGHTDVRGSAADNLRLSSARARAVQEYLIRLGVASLRLSIRGYGETAILNENDDESAHAENRRVEITELSDTGTD